MSSVFVTAFISWISFFKNKRVFFMNNSIFALSLKLLSNGYNFSLKVAY